MLDIEWNRYNSDSLINDTNYNLTFFEVVNFYIENI